jgi:hypothetical protein
MMMAKSLLASAMALALATAAHAAPVHRTGDLATLARDVDRAESVRAVKDLQRTYAQYAQFGLWRESVALFARDGVANFGDGPDFKGRAAVGKAFAEHFGKDGLKSGQLHTQLIEEPLVNLAPDGEHAQGRWYGFHLAADGQGAASIEGGVYENDYVREGGRWKIAALRFHPQYAGPYESGWTNWKNQPIGLTPYHFTADETGKPDLGANTPAPVTTATAGQLAARVQALIDAQNVRNLQNAYGYYVDRRMWDDVTDLFDDKGVVEVSGIGVYRGHAGVRRAMERMGPQGLTHGILNDHLQMDTVITVSPGGREAFARGIEFGMIADGDKDTSRWEVTVFHNRFVKEGGLWKLREARLYPHIRADYALGWGKSHMVEAAPTGDAAPDREEAMPTAEAQEHVIPAFLGPNPATGLPVGAPEGYRISAVLPLTGPIAAPARAAPAATAAWLTEQRRKLAMATAWDGAESVQTAYGMYIDDFQWPQMGAIFGSRGAKEVPFAGYYLGGERITNAVITEYGQPPTKPRAGISFHWLIQPMIVVASDGRSASVRTRLLQPRTGLVPSTAEAASKTGLFLGAGIWEGMYQNQAYLENGVWRLWNLTLDEPYVEANGWKLGWAGMKDRPQNRVSAPNPLIQKYPPDIAISILGAREEHFRGGPGETVAWPGILPMWVSYQNPVSGRTPKHFQPDCAPCEQAPDLKLTAHGYLLPPSSPTPE